MVLEKFKAGKPAAVYQRFREKGRILPHGVKYVDSWLATSFGRAGNRGARTFIGHTNFF
jgi:hypothetical protein